MQTANLKHEIQVCFVGCNPAAGKPVAGFADLRKPAGLYLGMNADDCGKLRDRDGAITENGWESVIVSAGKSDRRVYGLEFLNFRREMGEGMKVVIDD